MTELIRSIPWTAAEAANTDPLLTREWLVTNGLGGYASGTLSGAATRRFHGLLIAALPSPLGRTLMLNHLSEQLRWPNGHVVRLGSQERAGGALELGSAPYLIEFRLENGLPVWRYKLDGLVLEKRLNLLNKQNTVHITYRVLEGDARVRLKLMPSLHFRAHEGRVDQPLLNPYVVTAMDDQLEVSAGAPLPPLRMMLYGQGHHFTLKGQKVQRVFYRVEAARGYDNTGELWSPGYFGVDLGPGVEATLVASTESWKMMKALAPVEAYNAERQRLQQLLLVADPRAHDGFASELVLAADQFVITPAGRIEDAARAHASGDEVRTIIAGYHWFTDWGRDTMISLEGLTLTTGRHHEAAWILRTFAHYVRDGLIPNMFPEGEQEGLYHTADASLWFFQAMQRYLEHTNDRNTLRLVLPKLMDIVQQHLQGTRFGIGVDPADGLLKQGAEGYQLTWMDAKVDGWVVTPRRGKAVEINGLWYNALRLLEGWLREEVGAEAAQPLADAAERARLSFNQRFWYEAGGYLYDVVDGEQGDDNACRPNQLFSFSLTNPVLDQARWQPVLEVCRERLLTPVGLRSLAPGHPDYKPYYDGDLRARDAAYHQGTVWGWLIGPFINCWLKVHPDDRAGARHFLDGFAAHLNEACVGSISEVFDADAPYTPRGCVAQAWSIAEVLRCWALTAELPVASPATADQSPAPAGRG